MSEKFDDTAVNRRARQLWDDDRGSYGLAPAELHTLHIDVWNAWKDKARAELAAEAQPDPEAAVLAKAKEMMWEERDPSWRTHYLDRARAALTPKAPPTPKTEVEVRTRLFDMFGFHVPDEDVAEVFSWTAAAKGEAA